jgi:hypothetical protein
MTIGGVTSPTSRPILDQGTSDLPPCSTTDHNMTFHLLLVGIILQLSEINVVLTNFLKALGQEARETEEAAEVSRLSPSKQAFKKCHEPHTDAFLTYQDLKMVCSCTPSVSQRPSRDTLDILRVERRIRRILVRAIHRRLY